MGSSSQPAVLLIGGLAHCNKEWSDLSSKYTLKEFRQGNREQFLANCKNGEYDNVIGLYRSNASTSETGNFDKDLLSQLPKALKYIAHNGAGYDNIDVEAFTTAGIQISSTPIAVDNATADVAILLMLGALRHVQIPLNGIRSGNWRGAAPLGHDPENKILGILGMGGIGRAVAHRARAFGMTIIYHNRSRLSPELEGDAKYVSFDDLLAQSDILSLNLALNASTKHIINTPEFNKMKDGVVIVNTARGALINEKALVSALDSGKVSSAGLDVFENEPEVEEGLLKNDKIFIVPHIGTMTYETQRDMELLVLRNLESAVDGKGLITGIPEQKEMRASAS